MKICIIGKGNVGEHLKNGFESCGVEVISIGARNSASLPPDCDIYLICVKDSTIGEIVERFRDDFPENSIVAHTSGSVGIEVLKGILDVRNINCGVFYPLQTFTKGVNMVYRDIPFLIEGDSMTTEEQLLNLAHKLSGNVAVADSILRAEYHLAAVLACNFSTQLCKLADRYLKDKGGDFSMLIPLMRQTVNKLENVSPAEALTGPAKRGDIGVIEKQIARLSDYPDIKKIYKVLTESIINDNSGEN